MMYTRPSFFRGFAAAPLCSCPKAFLAVSIYDVLIIMFPACSSVLATVYQDQMPVAQYSIGSGNACLSANAYMGGKCSSDADAAAVAVAIVHGQ